MSQRVVSVMFYSDQRERGHADSDFHLLFLLDI